MSGMGSRRLDRLADLVRHDMRLHAQCRRCDNDSVIDAAKLMRWFLCHNWPDVLDAVPRRLRCSQCHARAPRVLPSPSRASGPSERFWPDDDGWKRLVRRLRG
jgi:hypothetical protein